MYKFIFWFCLTFFSLGIHAHGSKQDADKQSHLLYEQKEWGIASGHAKAHRIIQINMSDSMTFSPKLIKVKLGEHIKFMIRNKGQAFHEFVLGTPEELTVHAELMRRFPDMEHDEPYMAHVPAGQNGQIDWLFNREGEFEFACLMPGHFEAGMVGRIVVSKK
jgi:uncharacterized cupredoxin-like copper-binding protein